MSDSLEDNGEDHEQDARSLDGDSDKENKSSISKGSGISRQSTRKSQDKGIDRQDVRKSEDGVDKQSESKLPADSVIDQATNTTLQQTPYPSGTELGDSIPHIKIKHLKSRTSIHGHQAKKYGIIRKLPTVIPSQEASVKGSQFRVLLKAREKGSTESPYAFSDRTLPVLRHNKVNKVCPNKEQKKDEEEEEIVLGKDEPYKTMYNAMDLIEVTQGEVEEIFTAVIRRFPASPEKAVDPCTPPCVYWSVEDVLMWVRRIGFEKYSECFKINFITGRKLICLDASAFPKIGITDLQDTMAITKEIRELLNVDYYPNFARTVALPYRDPRGRFLDKKRFTGVKSDALTYKKFLDDNGYDDKRGCTIRDYVPIPRRCCICYKGTGPCKKCRNVPPLPPYDWI